MIEIKQGEIWHRDDFPLLCMWRRLTRCVEVGVELGEYSKVFIERHWNLEVYLGIDPYSNYNEMLWERDSEYQQAINQYSKFWAKAKLIREDSLTAAKAISSLQGRSGICGQPFHFVYLDGDHSKEAVAKDLRAWWPLIADKGIIAGHDWWMPSGEHPGVQEAVKEFAEVVNRDIYYTYLDDPQSWYIYKSEKPRGDWERKL